MNLKKINEIINNLSIITLKPFEFNRIHINVNCVLRAKHPKTWTNATHYHPWFEFNYVSKGSVYTTINGTEFLVSSGESYLIPPGIMHSHRNNGVGDDGICIRFNVDMEKGDPINHSTSVNLSTPHPIPFKSNVERLSIKGNILSIQSEFAAWLMHIANIWDNSAFPGIPVFNNILSQQVIIFLKEYYNTKIKVYDISNALNVSYRTLARRFKSETGITVFEKLTQIRINKAKELLLNTNMSMYDIAVSVGYENEFYFSKKFKEYEKISPRAFRADLTCKS